MADVFDVAVVGAGPGGSAAARRCASAGLKTVLLEKRRLPRNKVCTGMIMSNMCQALIKEEFGDPPPEALTTPAHVHGIRLRAPGAATFTLKQEMPFAWRKDFDYWLNLGAKRAGAELWDRSGVQDIKEEEGNYVLTLAGGGHSRLLRARFLIGADGAVSKVRKTLFPEARMECQLAVRRCYASSLDLEPDYVHYFFLPDLNGFEINVKDDVFLMELTPRPLQKDGAEIATKAEEWLTREFGFRPGTRPLWRDGCWNPAMGKRPFPGEFPFARENALLVGDAAGLSKPVTGEGIGTAMKSGLLAAEAVIKAVKIGKKAADYYIPAGNDMVSDMCSLYPPSGKIRQDAARGMDYLLETLQEIYSRSMHIL